MGHYDFVFRIRRRSAEASHRADEHQTMRIGIAGAGAIGRSVAQELLAYGHKVLLIENNVRHYEPQTVPDADWLLADACELTSLEESGMQTCDVVIAATGDDKVNLAAAAAGQDRVRGGQGGGTGQRRAQRMAVHRGMGRRCRGLCAARPGRGDRGRNRHRSPGAADGAETGPGELGQTDAARGRSVGRQAGARPTPAREHRCWPS